MPRKEQKPASRSRRILRLCSYALGGIVLTLTLPLGGVNSIMAQK